MGLKILDAFCPESREPSSGQTPGYTRLQTTRVLEEQGRRN
jgi:hypothetical protein